MLQAVVRPSGGHAVALNWSMYNIYGMRPGDVWWAASDLGWVVGHSYIAYAPLLHGNTTVVFEVSEVRQVVPDNGLCGGSLLHRLCPTASQQHHRCV